MMEKTWSLVRIELLRKWPFVALLAALWLFVCLAVWMGIRSMYGAGRGLGGDVGGPIALLFPLVYSVILGAALFQSGEKDGVRCFLYFHPVSRVRIYLVRYLTGVVLVSLLSVPTLWLTPRLFASSWSEIAAASDWEKYVWVLPSICLLLYTSAAFFSPLFASDLVTVPAAWIYGFVVGCGLLLYAGSAPLSQVVMWLIGSAVVFLCGVGLFRRRRILESSWHRRAATAFVFSGVTILVLILLMFVDFIDLLYLLGIDVFKWG